MLSDDLREELAAIAPERDCDRLAELSGLFHVAGSAHLRGRGSVDVHLDLVSSGGGPPRVRAPARVRGRVGDPHVPAAGVRPLDALPAPRRGVAATRTRPCTAPACSTRPTGRSTIRRSASSRAAAASGAYLRGALLGAGTLSGPRDAHLEIRAAEPEGARFLAELAARGGRRAALHERATHAVAYAKGTEAIADVLVAAGASDLTLALEEQAVLAATRADANRLANADHANLVRTSRAAHAQLEALRRLDLHTLPEELHEIASLRLRHPTASTAELAGRCRPPLTKASAYRRLRRLQALSEQ